MSARHSRIEADPQCSKGSPQSTPERLQTFLPLYLLKNISYLFNQPAPPGRNDTHPALIGRADEDVSANLANGPFEMQIGLRLPSQRLIEIAGEYLPHRAVVQLDDMAFGVRSDFL
ncbi:hypothetical protein Q2941_37090 [Bradyrhizobium sp. UFLA05-153]